MSELNLSEALFDLTNRRMRKRGKIFADSNDKKDFLNSDRHEDQSLQASQRTIKFEIKKFIWICTPIAKKYRKDLKEAFLLLSLAIGLPPLAIGSYIYGAVFFYVALRIEPKLFYWNNLVAILFSILFFSHVFILKSQSNNSLFYFEKIYQKLVFNIKSDLLRAMGIYLRVIE